MKIVIKFVGVGVGDNYQARVKVLDSCKRIVFDGFSSNGVLVLCLNEGEYYFLEACCLGEIINKTFYVNGINKEYVFAFGYAMICGSNNSRSITFLLSDYYYNNLPIEKGEILV